MSPLSNEELTIERCQPGPEVIRLDWKGRSTARRPGDAIDPFLSEVLAEARRSSSAIEMHFETLEYLNSSTVAVLVQFLNRARASGVSLCFTYRPSVRWQKLSFEALRVFEQVDKLVRVVPVSGG